ncbi:hypothetical protein [Trinickia sp.]
MHQRRQIAVHAAQIDSRVAKFIYDAGGLCFVRGLARRLRRERASGRR